MFNKKTILTVTAISIIFVSAPAIAAGSGNAGATSAPAASSGGNSAAAAANPTSNPATGNAPAVGQSPGLAAPGGYGLNAGTPPAPPISSEALRPAPEPVTDPAEIAKQQDLNALFDDIDKDRNGQINETEYSRFYKTIAGDTHFASYDLDHDVAISRAEFQAYNTVNGKIVKPE